MPNVPLLLAATGASGCLYGLMLFLVVDRLLASQTNHGQCFPVLVQLTMLLLPYIITSVPLSIYYNVPQDAHVGGALVGFLLGIRVLGCPLVCVCEEDRINRKICQRLAVALLILYFVLNLIIFFLREAPIADVINYRDIRFNDTIIYPHSENN